MSAQSPSTRKQCDFTKLIMAGYELELNNGNTQDFCVIFNGPKETIYEGGVWKVHVTLPDDYPFASPSIGFINKILHPNVDEASGSVCLDVINQTWTPLYSLVNVFEVFLPQLLTYPNPSDPLNNDAASLLLRDKKLYEEKVKEHVKIYASRESCEINKTIQSKKMKSRERNNEESSSSCTNNNNNISNNNNNGYINGNVNNHFNTNEDEEEEDDDDDDEDDEDNHSDYDIDQIDIDDL